MSSEFSFLAWKKFPPSEWTLIQKRGQFGNPKDFFSSKLWDDYVTGFGEPEKGEDTRIKEACLVTILPVFSNFVSNINS